MSTERTALLAELASVSREGASRSLMLHQAVADRFGLGPSDIKCLDLARDVPDLTAGRLAEATGLSTSAVTSVLDRLERAGFIERVRGMDDRRKVHVRSTGRHEAALGAVFAEVAEAFGAVAARHPDAELRSFVTIMTEFNRAALGLARSIADRNRDQARAETPPEMPQ